MTSLSSLLLTFASVKNLNYILLNTQIQRLCVYESELSSVTVRNVDSRHTGRAIFFIDYKPIVIRIFFHLFLFCEFQLSIFER